MSVSRDRKEAAKRLGLALDKRHRELALAIGDDAIAAAAVELGQLFNDNIEFIVWTLKTYGGLKPPVPAPRKVALPKTPAALLN